MKPTANSVVHSKSLTALVPIVCVAFSCPRCSCPAFSCLHLVLHFHVLHFQRPWIYLRQTKLKSQNPFYTHLRIHFTSENALFLWYLHVCHSVSLQLIHIPVVHSILKCDTKCDLPTKGRSKCCTRLSVRLSVRLSIHPSRRSRASDLVVTSP